jgi:hypothetical protein
MHTSITAWFLCVSTIYRAMQGFKRKETNKKERRNERTKGRKEKRGYKGHGTSNKQAYHEKERFRLCSMRIIQPSTRKSRNILSRIFLFITCITIYSNHLKFYFFSLNFFNIWFFYFVYNRRYKGSIFFDMNPCLLNFFETSVIFLWFV